jgi:hypothetical protein
LAPARIHRITDCSSRTWCLAAPEGPISEFGGVGVRWVLAGGNLKRVGYLVGLGVDLSAI